MIPRSLHQLCKHGGAISFSASGLAGACRRHAATAASCSEDGSVRGAGACSTSTHEQHASSAAGGPEQQASASDTSSCAGAPAAAARASQPASTSSAFWWLQGGASSTVQHSSIAGFPANPSSLVQPNALAFSATLSHHRHKATASLLTPPSLPLSVLATSSSPSLAQQPALPFSWLQHRGYKSNKKSMKPVHVKSNRLAVEPLLPPITPEEQERRTRYQRAPIIDTALPPIPSVPRPPTISRVGHITRGYQLEMQPKFAVVELAGTQFKVTVDDVIFINSLSGQTRINEVLSLGRVMLLGSTETTLIGRPYVPGAYVEAAVEEHFLDGKVHVFKFKRRNRYRKYAAPRPQLTTLRILDIHGLPGDGAGLQGAGGMQGLPGASSGSGGAVSPPAVSSPSASVPESAAFESAAGGVIGGAEVPGGSASGVAAGDVVQGAAQAPVRHPALPISYYAQAQRLQ